MDDEVRCDPNTRGCVKSDALQLHLASLLAEVSIVVGFVHELKNKLNFLSLATSNLAYRIRSDSGLAGGSEYAQRLLAIEDGIGEVYGLVQGLAKLQSTQSAGTRPTDLNSIVVNALTLLQPRFGSKRLRVVSRLSSRLNEGSSGMLADVTQMDQVVLNLLINACEASPSGGAIAVTTSMMVDRGMVALRIADEGTGIPGDKLSRVREPCFSTKQWSVGLGLAVSKTIVEGKLRGSIRLRSRSGKGTAVTVLLPLVTAYCANTQTPVTPGRAGR